MVPVTAPKGSTNAPTNHKRTKAPWRQKLFRYLTMASVLSNTAEAFPLAFALVMLCAVFFFTTWVVADNTCASREKVNGDVRPNVGNTRSSWVANSVQRLELLVSRSSSASLSESMAKVPSLMNSSRSRVEVVDGAEVPYDEPDETHKSTLQGLSLIHI